MLRGSTGRSRRAFVFSFALVTSAFLATAPSVIGYELNGVHWTIVSQSPSTVVKIYLDDSLTTQEVNLRAVSRDTIDEYNALPALNPWLDEVSTDTNEKIFVKTANLDDPDVFAQASIQYTGNLISYVTIKFNTLILWTTTVSGFCDDPPGPTDWQCRQDARKTSNHEMGHAQGLAHEFSPTVAVMRQGFLSYYHVQDDDENGIVDIYEAYP